MRGKFFKRSGKCLKLWETSGALRRRDERFRAEVDFLLRTLVNRVSCNRSQIHQLERDLTDFEKLAAQQELPREIRQAVNQMRRRCGGSGLSENQLRERLDKLKELQILPEHRVQPDMSSDGDC